jgi:hypothetical protein
MAPVSSPASMGFEPIIFLLSLSNHIWMEAYLEIFFMRCGRRGMDLHASCMTNGTVEMMEQ